MLTASTPLFGFGFMPGRLHAQMAPRPDIPCELKILASRLRSREGGEKKVVTKGVSGGLKTDHSVAKLLPTVNE